MVKGDGGGVRGEEVGGEEVGVGFGVGEGDVVVWGRRGGAFGAGHFGGIWWLCVVLDVLGWSYVGYLGLELCILGRGWKSWGQMRKISRRQQDAVAVRGRGVAGQFRGSGPWLQGQAPSQGMTSPPLDAPILSLQPPNFWRLELDLAKTVLIVRRTGVWHPQLKTEISF